MYSIANSTVLALLLLCCAAVPVNIASPARIALSSLPVVFGDFALLLFEDGVDGGNKAAISCNAVLMRFRRPCSASLCEVRLEVRFVERFSGYDTPGRWVPSRMFW